MENVYLIMQSSIDEDWPIEAYQFERVAEARLKELQDSKASRYDSFFIQEMKLDKKIL